MDENDKKKDINDLFINGIIGDALITDAAKAIVKLYKAIKDEGVSSIEAMQLLRIIIETGQKGVK